MLPFVLRVKSDAQTCCMVEHTFPQEPFRECYENRSTTSMDNQTVICIHKCYYEAIGMFSADGKLQTESYFKYRDALDPTLRDSFSFSLKVCANILFKLIKQNVTDWSKMRCSPLPYLFNRCLMEVGIANCPAERWMNCELK
uniref:Uncharacterized protein n=1 Tax=Anopheles christyi TaxID=43041 RepID=A0A182KDB8_9DIPT